MAKNTCPQCNKEINDALLFQCVRCFTKYCSECADTNEGRKCPKCGMSARLLLTPDKPATAAK